MNNDRMMTESEPKESEGEGAPGLPSAGQQPRYLWLAGLLREAIQRNDFEDYAALPSERELSEKYSVSRETVRKALRHLEERGLLYSDHGRGTFVAPTLVRKTARSIDGFSLNASSKGVLPGQKVLTFELTGASLAVSGILGVPLGSQLLRIRRLRSYNGQAVGLHDAMLRLDRSQLFDVEQLEKTGSLYALLSQKGLALSEAIENLCAIAADSDDANLLGVPAGSPLLAVERVTLSERREPVEYCLMKYLPTFRYTTRITKQSGAFD